jgi:hypothetical protein
MFTYFYHSTIRKSVSIFGSLFNNLFIVRKNAAGATISQVKCPLSYAPKRNFIDRLKNMASGEDAERQIAVKLPRMSFEISDYSYDAARQLIKTNHYNTQGVVASDTKRAKIRPGTPYTISFELNIYAKSQDDALQIVEQIMPYFVPQYSVTIKPLDDVPTHKLDVPIVLTGVSFQDNYEGAIGDARAIIYTLSFDMKTEFYGPITDGGIIKSAIMDINLLKQGLFDSDYKIETITVVPNPNTIIADSDYGFTTTIDFDFDDSAGE